MLSRIPLPFLMLTAGLMYGPNASIMLIFSSHDWPLLYGGICSLGMSTSFLLGALLLGRGQGLDWRALTPPRVGWGALLLILLSRLSYPFYVLSGAYIHIVVSGVMTALLPGVQVLASWWQRRRSSEAQPWVPRCCWPAAWDSWVDISVPWFGPIDRLVIKFF